MNESQALRWAEAWCEADSHREIRLARLIDVGRGGFRWRATAMDPRFPLGWWAEWGDTLAEALVALRDSLVAKS